MTEIIINGIVAVRDFEPYIQIIKSDGKGGEQVLAQFSIAEARNDAMDILQMSARTEADAMIRKFFVSEQFPEGAANALMMQFRDYRVKLDAEKIETSISDPDTGEVIQ